MLTYSFSYTNNNNKRSLIVKRPRRNCLSYLDLCSIILGQSALSLTKLGSTVRLTLFKLSKYDERLLLHCRRFDFRLEGKIY